MVTETKTRYWDSCNFISLIAEDEMERADTCQRILDDVAQAKIPFIITSTLTIAEVIRPKGQQIVTEEAEDKISAFFEHEYILVHEVRRKDAEKARELSRRYGLRPNDAVHLATALNAGAHIFETWNMNDFGRITDLSIEIREPRWTGNLEMGIQPEGGDWGSQLPPFSE